MVKTEVTVTIMVAVMVAVKIMVAEITIVVVVKAFETAAKPDEIPSAVGGCVSITRVIRKCRVGHGIPLLAVVP